MRNLITIAGVALMVTATPSLAQKGNGHGNGHGGGMPERMSDGGEGMRQGNDKPDGWKHAMRDNDDDDTRANPAGHGRHSCPPGLAKKSPACKPPGQAKKSFTQGQRLPAGYRDYTAYNAIPEQYRASVPYDAANRYIYRDNQVYVVNPQTQLITRIINLIR